MGVNTIILLVNNTKIFSIRLCVAGQNKTIMTPRKVELPEDVMEVTSISAGGINFWSYMKLMRSILPHT